MGFGGGSQREPAIRSSPTTQSVCLQDAHDFVYTRELGRGGMGVVLEAQQQALERPVALKTIHAELTHGAAVERFTTEAQIMGRLEHPNIVPVHAFGWDRGGLPYLCMKVVRGMPWSDLLHPATPEQRTRAAALDRRDQLRILQQVCGAVALAHARGVVHRDLKPANVLVGEYGEVLVTDWGIALELALRPLPGQKPPVLTGTPAYLPPEMASGEEATQGCWTDIYLLGGILYEILTGSQPHARATVQEALASALAGDVIIPAEVVVRRGLPRSLCRIAEQALRHDPRARTASATAFAQEIESFLQQEAEAKLIEPALDQLARVEEAAVAQRGSRGARYADFARATAALEQARSLFPTSPAATAGVIRARLAHARDALANGDAGVAEVQLASLTVAGLVEDAAESAPPEPPAGLEAGEVHQGSPPPGRALLQLRQELAALRQRQRRDQRRRGRNLILLALAVLTALGGGLFAWRGHRRSAAAEAAATRRQQAVAQTEGSTWVSYQEKIARFQRAVQIDPTWLEGYSELTQAWIGESLEHDESDPAACAYALRQARVATEAVLRLNPGHAGGHYYRGYTAQMLGAPGLGLADLRRAAALSPRTRDGLSAASAVLLLEGRFAEAELTAGASINSQGDEDDYTQRALARFVLGELDGALDDLRAAEAILPDQHDYDGLTALVLYAQGQSYAAGERLVASLRRHRHVPHILPLLAYLAARRGDQAEALALAAVARQVRDQFAACYPSPLFRVLAQAPPPRDELGRAFVLQQELAAVAPTTPPRGVRLRAAGEELLVQGASAGALAHAEQALAEDPTDGLARWLAGRCLAELGHPAAARRELELVERLAPSQATAAQELLRQLTGAER